MNPTNPPFKVLVTTDLADDSLELLKGADDIELQRVAPHLPTIRGHLAETHALISRDDVTIDADFLRNAPHLRIIARVTTGLNGIDLEAATTRGIMVMNTPGANATAAGEHTLTLMLALSRRLTTAHNSLREGYWLLDRKRQAGTQLFGKTIGLIGLGRVGKIVAYRCLAFGMNVLAYDPYVIEDQTHDERVQLVGLRELQARSDFISLHVPATRETQRLVDADFLAQMKPGARLINTAHGSIVDETALAEAIKAGHLAGAAIDVYNEEPPYSSPLIGLDQVIHTPHIGDNTLEATQDLSIKVVEQVLDALRDEDYRNVVNMPIMPGVAYEIIRPYLRLAECIGTIQHTLARSPIRRVAIEIQGPELAGLIKPLTVGVLKGLLTPILGNQVSTVNAPILATERGWQISQAKGLRGGEYSNQLTCQVTLEDNEEIIVTGILLDHKEPRIVQINQYRMNFVPTGQLLLMGSFDMPGVIGRVGTLMSSRSVNIASWHTGRAEPGGHTLTVLTLDEPIPDEIFNELMQLDFVRHLHSLAL